MSREISAPNPNPERRGSAPKDTGDVGRTTNGATAMAYATGGTRSERISEAATHAKDYVSDRVAGVGERIRELQTPGLNEYVQQNPGWAILLSAAVGFLCSRLILPRAQVRYQPAIKPSMEQAVVTTQHVAPALGLHTRKEYVISSPSGFQLASGRYRDQLKQLVPSETVQILDSLDEDADKLVSLTEEEVGRLKATLPGLVIEPNIVYKKSRHPLLDDFQVLNLLFSANTKKIWIKVSDHITGRPVPGASVYLSVELNPASGFEGTTDGRGICELVVGRSHRQFPQLIVLPRDGYWGRYARDVVIDTQYDVSVRTLPSTASALYDWGHQFAQMRDGLPINAEEVKIGIIDSGICKDHPGITPAGGWNCVYGEDPSLWDNDSDGHGTHVAGVVAATISKRGKGIKGYVPQAKIFSYRTFGEGAAGALTFDLAKAIQKAVEDGCDIINMSLGSRTLQTAIRSKTEMAYDRGVLCIAATGNNGAAVNYPAAFDHVMGVGAFGKFGAYPEDSLHQLTETNIRSVDGNYYIANFSNFGAGVDFCAPGVAILSTVPGGDYSAWDGTSMACPQVTGIAALALAAHQDIFKAPRNADRVERLIQTLKSRTQKLNFGLKYEGAGCLTVPPMLVP